MPKVLTKQVQNKMSSYFFNFSGHLYKPEVKNPAGTCQTKGFSPRCPGLLNPATIKACIMKTLKKRR